MVFTALLSTSPQVGGTETAGLKGATDAIATQFGLIGGLVAVSADLASDANPKVKVDPVPEGRDTPSSRPGKAGSAAHFERNDVTIICETVH